MSFAASSRTFCDGLSRRHLLQAGLGGMIGLSLPQIRRLQAETSAAAGTPARQTAVIYLELAGGPTQHETYDPKPLAPVEVRGPLRAIDTAIPGVQFSELMTAQAKIADKLAIIRSVTHTSGSHQTSAHLTQTGYYLRDPQNKENEMPCLGSVSARLRGSNVTGMPSFVSLPSSMRYGRPGWLGKGYAPFETVNDASGDNFTVPNLSLASGLTPERLSDRIGLLQELDASRRFHDTQGTIQAIDRFTQEAFEMLSGQHARQAFDIASEAAATRDRYGRNPVGQNMLLARRLVERGVTFVTVRVTGWDDHSNIEKAMNSKGPAYDQAVAALVTDLYDRGLERDVLVVAMGEFGRTPRINKNAGRDHWGRVMSVMLAGGGLQAGQIIGASDSNGASPVSGMCRPENVLAIVYRHLGIDPSMTINDHTGRPRHLLEERRSIPELI